MQKTLKPTLSTYVMSRGSASYTGAVRVGHGSDSEARAFLRFDLSDISGTINSATLELYSYNGGNEWQSAVEIECKHVTEAWGNNLSWDNLPNVTAPSYGASTHSGYNVWYSFDVKSLITAMLSSGGTGICIRQVGSTAQRAKAFKAGKDGIYPRLIINYTPEEPTPPDPPTPPEPTGQDHIYVFVNGAWKLATAYVFSGGTWGLASPYCFKGDAWKRMNN